MKISVIVPFYNTQQTIEECAEALLRQTYYEDDYEIIMVDNNSRDASAEIVKRHPKIKLVSEEKQGAYAARNRGVKEARGQILAFTDPDCIPADDWLEKIASAMKHSRIGIVIGRRQSPGGSPILSMLEAYEHEKNNYVFNSKINEIYFGYCNNMAVRRKLFDEVGPFIERPRGADTIFMRHCVDKYSSDIARYFPDISVLHMEVDTLAKLYRKVFIYGGSRQKYKHIAFVRPLTNRERFMLFRMTTKGQRYSLIKSSFFLGLLIVGFLFWVSGAKRAIWQIKRQSLSS